MRKSARAMTLDPEMSSGSLHEKGISSKSGEIHESNITQTHRSTIFHRAAIGRSDRKR